MSVDRRPTASPARLKALIGLACEGATIGLGGRLRLSFPAPARWPHRYAPSVESEASTWRILTSGLVIAGQYDCTDWERGLEGALQELRGRIVEQVGVTAGRSDVRFLLSGARSVEFLESSRSDIGWLGHLPDGRAFEVGPGGAWDELDDDAAGTLHVEEQRLAEHAKAFGQRWRDRVPPPAAIGRCGDCAFFRPLSGGFDYWDFGVCSNGQGPFDGRLVRTGSGCDAYGHGDASAKHRS